MFDKFRHLLEKNNETIYRVAKDTGISAVCLYDWKAGRSTPKIDKLKKIADHFGVSVEELI